MKRSVRLLHIDSQGYHNGRYYGIAHRNLRDELMRLYGVFEDGEMVATLRAPNRTYAVHEATSTRRWYR